MTLQHNVEAGIKAALSLIGSRYENNPDPDNDMPFHCVEHTVGVIRRTAALSRAMGASEREFEVSRLAAAFHDTVQRWEPNNTPDGRVLRKRFTTQNEIDSAAEGVQWMRQSGNGAFDDRDCELLTRAIVATVPGWDGANGTVLQPNLAADSSPAIRAVALADLGIPGMEGAVYVETGDQLFREENLDIARALRQCSSRTDLPEAQLEAWKARMLGWCRGQVAYARGRQARLPLELGNIDGAHRNAVEALFCKFDEAIAAAEEVIRVRSALSPWDVAQVMGYKVPG